MNLQWNTILTQMALWIIGLGALGLIVARTLRRLIRVRLPLGRLLVLLFVLSFLLGLIPNLQLKGPGRGGGGDGGTRGGQGGKVTDGRNTGQTSGASVVLRVYRRGAEGYELWVEGKGMSKGPLPLTNTPSFRRDLVRMLRNAAGGNEVAQPMMVGLDLPPSVSSDVARAVLEDMLRSEGLVVESVNR